MSYLSVTGTWETATLEFAIDLLNRYAGLIAVLAFAAAVIMGGYLVKLALEYTMHHLRRIPSGLNRLRGWVKKRLNLLPKMKLLRRVRGYTMWREKKSVIADVIFDAILDANARGVITNKERHEICTRVGKALDLPDLLPYALHKAYIRTWLLGERRQLLHPTAGPKQTMTAGDPPPKNTVVFHSKFLEKMKEKKVA